MADTLRLWVECKHGEGDDFLHYGDRNVRRVGEDAARGRIVTELLEAFGVADEGLQVLSSGRFGFRPEREWVLDLAAKVLRAAAGENG